MRKIIKRDLIRDKNNLELVEKLIQAKFIRIGKKSVKKPRRGEFEINIMLSRMISSMKYIDLIQEIEDNTKFLNNSYSIKDRIFAIFHNLKEFPKCKFCNAEIKTFSYPLSLGYSETCKSQECTFKLREETFGGPVASGKHNFTKEGMEAIKNGAKNRPSKKGKSWKEILKNPENYESLLEKLSKNADRSTVGWFSKYRCEKINPYTDKIIILMSSYEIAFFEFCIKNNIWFDSCHARLKYWNSVKNAYRYYNPDFIVKYNNCYYMIEIKPSQVLLNNNNKYNIISRDKIKRLFEHCENYNRICLILTENELKDEEKIKNLIKNKKSNYSEYINEN